MLHIVLFEPEIPPNTGNIIRLCANTRLQLHLVKPLGFELSDKQLKRAGLDYHEYATVQIHENWTACAEKLAGKRIFPCTTKATRFYTQMQFQEEDVLLFGPETRGLPHDLRMSFPHEQWLRIPMCPESRSLNLSNAVAVIAFEALRQLDFKNLQ